MTSELVGVYARISSDPTGERLGVDRQVADCTERAARAGWAVGGVYVDDDRSAWSGKARPEYERMLTDLKDGTIRGVVVWDLDRLHRHPKELERFLDLVAATGAHRLATVSGQVDLATADGQFHARILGAVAKKESDDKSRRIRRKHQQLAADGRVSGGGTRPFGYDTDRRTIRPDEAAIIREAADRVLAGEALGSICRDLTARKVRTVSGAAWRTTILKRILTSARISGQREHHGEIVGPAEWPAIVTAEQTARLRAALGERSSRQRRSAPRRYLLAGTLRCAICGQRLVSRPRQDGQRRYVCAKGPNFTGCGAIAVRADPIEELIVEAVLYRLDSPAVADAIRNIDHDTDDDLQRARTQLDGDRARSEELSTMWAAGEISRREWDAARLVLTDRIAVNEQLLARLTNTTAIHQWIGHADELRARWDDLPVTRQAAIVRALLDHATVGPAVRGRNTFDPARVTPAWKY